MTFFIQLPGDNSHLNLLNESALNARSGGGVFAFATVGGISLFFEQSNIANIARHGEFKLIVGLDAITNLEAIYYLRERAREFHGLQAFAMLNDNPGRTFHPKFSWFRHAGCSIIIAGSGNLTVPGLGRTIRNGAGNWEAFNVLRIPGTDIPVELQNIEAMFSQLTSNGQLLSLDDVQVIDRAAMNSQIRPIRIKYTLSKAVAAKNANKKEHIEALEEEQNIREILVRELPRNRSGQADVGKEALTKFFGFNGQPHDILTQYVSLDNQVHDRREQRIFVNKSQNYRIELREIRDIGYDLAPDDGRMILVACKLDSRLFRYTLIPTTKLAHYQRMAATLGAVPAGNRKMRTKFMSLEELKLAWPDVPNNLLPIEVNVLAS